MQGCGYIFWVVTKNNNAERGQEYEIKKKKGDIEKEKGVN